MVFSSTTFLFFFLPLLFLVYFIIPKRFKNICLLIFSLVFYMFKETWFIILLLATCLLNYICGLLIDKTKKKKFLVYGMIINIGMLFYFKYANFFIENISNIFNLNISTLNIVLPLGISFFTFQNISYLVDVYRGEVEPQKNFLTYATYITFFPQLVAGPIVRYKDINDELKNRKESNELLSKGIKRFIIGLSKKVLIADVLYALHSDILSSSMSTLSYWLAAIIYTFHIYYDFSGYSDMAIGLGNMFGFNFKENFNYPLIASSVTDFWRRWHMSLSSFFKDYVYIPLGGSKTSTIKTVRNIFIVWLLTGFWHGASWNFILWGLYFFIFLIIEKFFLKKFLVNKKNSQIYTFLIVVISFVIFSTTDLTEIATFLKGLVGVDTPILNFESVYYLKNSLVILVISFLGMSPLIKNVFENLKKGKKDNMVFALETICIFGLFILSIAKIVSSSFNPFIYFRF